MDSQYFEILSNRCDKLIRDSLREDIYVDPISLQFIDTLAFQRLRDVKQLGLCNFVYPGASHSRFEHSLGVYDLARRTVKNLFTNWPELEINKSDVQAVSLAGLLHDVGHGPFSHVFDNEFLRRLGIVWSHEEMSTRMVDYIVDENNIDIDASQLKRVKDMIRFGRDSTLSRGYGDKAFLFDIVANGRNSIDVDKFDYIARDCHACGIVCSLPFERFMNGMKVIDNEICFRSSDTNEIFNLFTTRADLFKKIYTHRKVKAMEFMLSDVFLLANDYLGIASSVDDPENFWKMDDTILKTIETSDVEELREARELARRMKMRGRHLYQFCNEYLVPADHVEHYKPVTPQDIVCCTESVNISEDDVLVCNLKIDLACNKKEPFQGVHFYTAPTDTVKFEADLEKVSGFVKLNSYVDRFVRVYAKKPEHVEAVSMAFEKFQKKKYNAKLRQLHGTPEGKKRKKSFSSA